MASLFHLCGLCTTHFIQAEWEKKVRLGPRVLRVGDLGDTTFAGTHKRQTGHFVFSQYLNGQNSREREKVKKVREHTH